MSRRQLLAAGLSKDEIDYRIEIGRLHPVHRGVYLVGHPAATRLATLTAAVLAGGNGAFLSRDAAAELWEIAPGRAGDIDISTTGRQIRRRPGIRPHRVPALSTADLRRRHGIPLTSPAFTLLDLSAERSRADLSEAVAEAHALRLATRSDLIDVLERYPARPGAARLSALLAADPREVARMRSVAERELWRLIKRARLPLPEANVVVEGQHVDFAWRDRRVVVEVDGYWFHSTRPKRRNDRRKDDVLRNAGWTVIRIDYEELLQEPEAVLVRIARSM